MTLARDLVVPVLDAITAGAGLREVAGRDGGPYRALTAIEDGGPAGSVRLFEGEAVPRLVYCHLALRARDLDSHMLYAFLPADSAVPHFTVDAVAVAGAGVQAYHVDLMPRVDLATAPSYLDDVLVPLDPTFRAVADDPAYRPAELTPKQRALMSPWMLAHRLDAADFPRTAGPVDAYLQHWLALVRDGVDAAAHGLRPADLAARDAITRKVIFGGDVDPAWDLASSAVGAEPIAELRALLVGPQR